MAKLIQKQEAQQLLNANRKHYLWLKPLSRWTEQDVANLRAGVNKNMGQLTAVKNKNYGN
jgi:hypothetical protein